MNKYAKIADETLEVLKNCSFSLKGNSFNLQDKIASSVNNTKFYPDGIDIKNYLIHTSDKTVKENKTPNIMVSNETTYSSIASLKSMGIDDICILNFASPYHVGGGWLSGAKAQEEDLCRASTLAVSLYNTSEYYEQNKLAQSHFYTNGIIYSPDVTFFSDDDANFIEPIDVSVITSPAPNVSAMIGSNDLADMDDNTYDHLLAMIEDRIENILRVAVCNNKRNLVLGAWGCGVFGNDPIIIANSFKDALTIMPYFDNIYFGVYDRSPLQYNYLSFKEIFSMV